MADTLTLNDDGTIEVWLDEKLLVPRPKIGQFRTICEAMERADAEWRKLVEVEEWPEDIVNLGSQLAVNDLGPGTAKGKLGERAMQYSMSLYQQRMMTSADNPFPVVWRAILKVLLDKDVSIDDMPAWMLSPVPLAAIRDHWMAVPLHLGPTTQPESNGQSTTPTQ